MYKEATLKEKKNHQIMDYVKLVVAVCNFLYLDWAFDFE